MIRERTLMIKRHCLSGLLLVSLSASSLAAQPFIFGGPLDLEVLDVPVVRGDPRFTGVYCEDDPISFCREIPLAPDICAQVKHLRIEVDHIVAGGGGLLLASGALTIDPPAFSGDDEPLRIVAAGAVHSRGLARVSATVSKVGKATGWASLSSNGQVLTVSALDREMHLTKQGCE